MFKKMIFSVIIVLALLISITNFAFADVIGGAGLLGSALSSLGVDLLASGGATMAMLAPWLNGDFSIRGDLTGVADGYIKVKSDSVIIDGVEYQSIFLDPNMAQTLHTQVFDFITQKSITSYSSGILASGYGYFDGIPVYWDGHDLTTIRSQKYVLPNDGNSMVGNVSVRTWTKANLSVGIEATLSDNVTVLNNATCAANYKPPYLQILEYRLTAFNSHDDAIKNVTIPTTLRLLDSFEYDYVAGSIDATPLPSDYGFNVLVPTGDVAQAGITTGTYINDGSTGTDTINDIIDLLDVLFASQDIKNPEFTDETIPPSPVPTMALSDVPYDVFVDTFGQSIEEKLDDVSDTVDTVGQSITDKLDDVDNTIDTVGQSIVDELEAQTDIFDTIGTAIDNIESAVTDVVDGIQVKVGEIADTLVDIKDGILEAIEEGPIKLIDSGIDVLRSIFGPILQTIRSHVGIWHYVVSWIQSISTPFTWILGIASGTSYFMVLPLYALIAGTLVIAIYKRFGR